MTDIINNICESVDIIVNKRLEGLAYDKTLTCVIEDSPNRKNGEYLVSNGQAKFTAYSENENYSKGTSVYVTVPNGDFNERKIIIGRCLANNDSKPFNYTAPFDRFIALSQNYAPEQQNDYYLLANYGTIGERSYYTFYDEDIFIDNTYDRLGIRGSFRTNLATFNVIKGNYGIEVELTTDTGIKILTLDIRDMFGSLYLFNGYSSQEKLFDIQNLSKISHIKISFFQDNNFIGKNGKYIPYCNEEGVFPYNIFLKDVELYLGYSIDSLREDKIFVYSENSSTYSDDDTEPDTKAIQMRWAHVVSPIEIQGIENMNDLNEFTKGAEIFWYRENYTREIPKEEFDKENIPYPGLFWENYLNNSFYFLFDPDYSKQQERLKVIIRYNKALYESEPITFMNKKQIANIETIDLLSRLNLICDDGFNGKYALYDFTTRLINPIEARKKRLLKFSYTAKFTGDELLDKAEKIVWKIPKVNTMIQEPQIDIEYSGNELDNLSDENYYLITRTAIRDSGDHEEKPVEDTQAFRIKEHYSPWNTNNTIICTAIRNGQEYSVKFSPTFSIQGNAGNQYSFSLTADKPALILSADKEDASLVLTANLTDYNGTDISDTINNIEWSLVGNDQMIKPYTIVSNETLKATIATPITNISNYEPIIIKALAHRVDGINLTTYFPLALTVSSDYLLEGATSIIYDSKGTNPHFYKEQYLLKNVKDTAPIADVSWERKVLVGKGKDISAYPILTKTNTIAPNQIYIENLQPVVINAIDKNKNIIWKQALYIGIDDPKNIYDNDTIGQNNKIVNNMIGIGSHNLNNEFSGLFMGELRDLDNISKKGIFGFHNDKCAYEFNANGKITLNELTDSENLFDFNLNTLNLKKDLKVGTYDFMPENIKSINKCTINPSNITKIKDISVEKQSVMVLTGYDESKKPILEKREIISNIIITNTDSKAIECAVDASVKTALIALKKE